MTNAPRRLHVVTASLHPREEEGYGNIMCQCLIAVYERMIIYQHKIKRSAARDAMSLMLSL